MTQTPEQIAAGLTETMREMTRGLSDGFCTETAPERALNAQTKGTLDDR